MSESMRYIGRSIDNDPLPQSDMAYRIHVSFGPQFYENATISRREFIAKLRAEAKERSESFLGLMFSHFADHLELGAEHVQPDQRDVYLDERVPVHMMTTYFGCAYPPCSDRYSLCDDGYNRWCELACP